MAEVERLKVAIPIYLGSGIDFVASDGSLLKKGRVVKKLGFESRSMLSLLVIWAGMPFSAKRLAVASGYQLLEPDWSRLHPNDESRVRSTIWRIRQGLEIAAEGLSENLHTNRYYSYYVWRYPEPGLELITDRQA